MPSSKTLREYINKLDEVILAKDTSAAEDLEKKVMAVFGSEFDGLKSGLTNYQPFLMAIAGDSVVDDTPPVDFIKDAEILKSRLQAELDKITPDFSEQSLRNSVFISHRSIDKDVADMLKDFLVATGIPNERIFCSSLPGNDVVNNIGKEVKKHLQDSIVNILILSKDYYESIYCLNEAGIAWYLEDEAAPIAVCLPEISESKMQGFFNSENKVRRLDNPNDLAAIYDVIRKKLNIADTSHSVVLAEQQKLIGRYKQYIALRQ